MARSGEAQVGWLALSDRFAEGGPLACAAHTVKPFVAVPSLTYLHTIAMCDFG